MFGLPRTAPRFAAGLLSLSLGCQALPSSSPTSESTEVEIDWATVPLARAGTEEPLDRHPDKGTLFGRLLVAPPRSDADRTFTLRAEGFELPPALIDARVLGARFSRDGTLLVLGSDHVLRAFDAAGQATVLDEVVEGPLSVEGSRVAYVRGQRPEGLEVAVVDLADGAARAVTAGMAPAWSPALSPDGREVAFVSGATGAPGVYVAPVEGGEPRALPRTERFPASPIGPRWVGDTLQFVDQHGQDAEVPLRPSPELPAPSPQTTALGGVR